MSNAQDLPQKKPQIVSGRKVKKSKFYLLQLGADSWFKMRRLDIMEMFFEGAFPTPILAAVDDLQGMRKLWIADSIVTALASVTPEQKINIKELLRRVAVRAVVEPRLTHSKREADADPDLLWVGGIPDNGEPQFDTDGDITLADLMIVWRSVMGESDVITLPYDEASDFRQSESESHAPVILDGEDVRTEAVVVDPDAGRDLATGKGRVRISYH